MGVEHFLTFILTAFIFIMTPGLDTIYVLNKSIAQGKKAGIYAALGINAGVLVHTLFAALGLSLIVAKSAIAFSVLKYLGAAYLIYLGVTKIISKKTMLSADTNKNDSSTNSQHFFSGFVTNTLNPKVALFFLAFFPQFINPAMITSPIPFVILGLTYAVLGIIWFLILSIFAAAFSAKFVSNHQTGKWLDKISGVVFILLGIKIALTKR